VNEEDFKVFRNNDLTEIIKECEWMFIHKVYQIYHKVRSYELVDI